MFRYYAIAALVQIVWSLTPSASNIVIQYLSVGTYAALRYSISGLLFLAFALWRDRRLRFRARDLPALAGLGVVTYGLSSLGTLHGLKLGGVVNFALASGLNATIT